MKTRRARVFNWSWLAVIACLSLGSPCLSARTSGAGFDFHQPFIASVLDEKVVSSGVISALAFEKSGLLWIGTQNGLLRFDGYSTLPFGHEARDPGSLAGDYVRCLVVDQEQRLWVGTQSDGLSVIDTRSLKITNHRHDPADPRSPGKGSIFALATSPGGAVFVGTDGGLSQFPAGTQGFHTDRHDIANPRSLPDDRVRALLVAGSGDLWVGTVSGLALRRAGSSDYVAVAASVDNPDSLHGKEVRSLLETQDGHIWVGTRQHGAAVVHAETGHVRWVGRGGSEVSMPHNWVYTMAQPRPDEVWLGTTGGGIAVVDANSLRIRRVLAQRAAGDSLGNNLVSALAQDSSGQLWIGSYGGGLQRTNAAQGAFRMVREPVLSQADVHSIMERRDGRILVGTFSNGIDVIDRSAGRIGSYRTGNAPADLPPGIVIALAETSDGALWAGTQQGGVLRLAPEAKAWERFDQSAGLPSALVHTLWPAADGGLWVGTAAGLARFNPAMQRFEHFRDDAGATYGTRVIRIAEDRRGRLWLATDDGLGLYEPGINAIRSVRHDENQPDSLSSNDVNGVLIDRSGKLWVDTAEGLNLLLREDGERFVFDNVSDRMGRPGQSFGGNLVEDSKGRIWTDSYVHDPLNARMDSFDHADGFDLGTHWTGAVATTRDGMLLFGGTRGLAIVDPEKYLPWTFTPKVVATELRVDGVSRPISPEPAGIVLLPDERNFSISFAALDLSEPAANRYSYRLDGIDAHWIETTAAHRIASYGNLWPGIYTLHLRGSNRRGDWSPQTLAIPITVMPQFWQTPAFFAFATLLLLSLIHFGYRWQLRTVVARARHLEQLVAARTSQLEAKNAAIEVAYARAEKAAHTDPLTGLGNRRWMSAQIIGQISTPAHAGNMRLACLLADVDRFKAINDLHGHAAGDAVLCAIAEELQRGVKGGALARWGGEEFLIVTRITDMSDAWQQAERLREAIARNPVDLGDGRQLACTCSIGIAIFPHQGADAPPRFETTIAVADAALYRAKRSGRNCCVGLELATVIRDGFEARLRDDPEQLIADGVLREWTAGLLRPA
jgi:diguanylate cyclase (GGDEF)-like protein